jgi:predicted  nucleic acid-binding Zn-ribbon protein
MENLNQNFQQSETKKDQNKGFITFGSPKKEEPSPEFIKLNSSISEMGRKLRVLEERYSNLRRKIQVTERNMLSIQRNIINEIKATDAQVLELQKMINGLDDKMKQIMSELNNFSPSNELKIISRYLDFWQPVGFITRREAEKLVRDIIEENRKI